MDAVIAVGAGQALIVLEDSGKSDRLDARWRMRALCSWCHSCTIDAVLREQAELLSEHNVFIHLLSAEELQPWMEALQQRDPGQTPLWGLPFVLKDNIDLAGIPTTAVCEAFSYVPDETAFVVQQPCSPMKPLSVIRPPAELLPIEAAF